MTRVYEEAQKLWREGFDALGVDAAHNPAFSAWVREQEQESECDADSHLQPWLQILEECTQWLANVAATLHREAFPRPISKEPRIVAAAVLIGTASNHAVAVRRLVRSGLETSARAVLRSLDEHLVASIIMLDDLELSREFIDAKDPEEASKLWFRSLKPELTKKRLNRLERNRGLDRNISYSFRRAREEVFTILSQATHPSFLTASLNLYTPTAADPDEARVSLAGGVASDFSHYTLEQACSSIWYFCQVGLPLLFGHPSLITLSKGDEMHDVVYVGRKVISELYIKYSDATDERVGDRDERNCD